MIKRKTAKGRMAAALKRIAQWCRAIDTGRSPRNSVPCDVDPDPWSTMPTTGSMATAAPCAASTVRSNGAGGSGSAGDRAKQS